MTRFKDIIEKLSDRETLQPTIIKAIRSSVSFMPPVILAGSGVITPMQGVMAGFAAHSVSMLDVRGTYLLRLSILSLQACIMIGLAWVGGETGMVVGVVPAIVASGLMAFLAGYLRHTLGEYGPGIATPAALLLFTAMAVPADSGAGYSTGLALAAVAGSIWGIALHIVKWPIDYQYPLRFAVGECWAAAALLFEAMAEVPLAKFVNRQKKITARELGLDQTLNRTRLALAGAGNPEQRPFLKPLTLLLHWAGAVSTNSVSLFALLGKRAGKDEMKFLAYPIRASLTSFSTVSRALALAIVSRRSDHRVRTEISLKRTLQLLEVLETRISLHVDNSDDRNHALELVRILKRFAEELSGVVQSVGVHDPHAQFSFQLIELKGPGVNALYGPVNFSLRMSRELFQYSLRLAIVLILGTTVFKILQLPHGYWIPFSSLVVLQPDFGSTWRRAFHRAAGTLLGVIAVGGLLHLHPPYWVLLLIIAVLCGVVAHFLKHNYTLAVFIVTIMLVVSMEAMGPVSFSLAIERLACCVLGSLLAFLAALTLWPFWERQRMRPLLARAIQCNRDYLKVLAGAFKAGAKAPGQRILPAKMQVETANADVFDSLRRMGKEPEAKRANLKAAAVLATGNYRLTRIFNALLAGIAPGRSPMDVSTVERFQNNMETALDVMTRFLNSPDESPPEWDTVQALLGKMRFDNASPGHDADWVISRFEHAATEAEGMLLAARALGK
jgi:hypothetical protein